VRQQARIEHKLQCLSLKNKKMGQTDRQTGLYIKFLCN
jgi:hypothetical protein